MFLFYSSFSEESFETVHIMLLSTLNMDLFAFECYWCRIEFAKSREQIHTHLFAIEKDITDNDQDDVMNIFSASLSDGIYGRKAYQMPLSYALLDA